MANNNYIFDKYKNKKDSQANLVKPKTIDANRVLQFAEAEALARDLINTPTSEMGPEGATTTRNFANKFGADYSEIVGENLRENSTIHTVGRASSQKPRLIEIKK